jgi:hypothetical protein
VFQNIAELSIHYPSINKKLQKLATFQRQYLRESLSLQQKQGIISGTSADIDLLLEIISLILFQSLNYYQMQGDPLGYPDIEYRTLMTIFFSLQPYCKNNDELEAIKQQILDKTLI